MDIDYGAIAILSLFRGVLGLAAGVALGNAYRSLRAHKILTGVIALANVVLYCGLVAFMHVSIQAYNDYPFVYWGVFTIALLAGSVKTNSVVKTLGLALYSLFGGSFFFVGGWMILSAVRLGFNIGALLGGVLFMAVGATILGALIYPYFRGKSLGEE